MADGSGYPAMTSSHGAAEAGELETAQAIWLLRHTLDCCERQVLSGEAVEFLTGHYPDSTRVAYVHAGHEPVRWRKWARWRADPYPGATLRRVRVRHGQTKPQEPPPDA